MIVFVLHLIAIAGLFFTALYQYKCCLEDDLVSNWILFVLILYVLAIGVITLSIPVIWIFFD